MHFQIKEVHFFYMKCILMEIQKQLPRQISGTKLQTGNNQQYIEAKLRQWFQYHIRTVQILQG